MKLSEGQPQRIVRTAFLDGSLTPIRFFTHSVLPIVTATQRGDKFLATKLVREASPLLSKDMLKGSEKPLDQLRTAQAAIDSLMSLWANGEPTCGAVLENVASTNLFVLPDSLKAALAASSAEPVVSEDDEEADPVSENVAALLALLDCPFSMIAPYASYVAHEASFDTHQGVKGLEFDRVMVLMDDGDAWLPFRIRQVARSQGAQRQRFEECSRGQGFLNRSHATAILRHV